jgi:hypothetical protein
MEDSFEDEKSHGFSETSAYYKEKELSINQEAFKTPLIFGTFTNWKVFQMIKT